MKTHQPSVARLRRRGRLLGVARRRPGRVHDHGVRRRLRGDAHRGRPRSAGRRRQLLARRVHAEPASRVRADEVHHRRERAVATVERPATDGRRAERHPDAPRRRSPRTAEGDELTGAVRAFNKLTTVFPRFSGDGFTPRRRHARARRSRSRRPARRVTKLQLGIRDARAPGVRVRSTQRYRGLRPGRGVHARTSPRTTGGGPTTCPYLDTPEDNIDKTLFYRWWLMRYNFLDADVPGNDYQFPTSMEGVLGYNNAIVLTVGMFVDDLKYFRDPIYSYGPVGVGRRGRRSAAKYIDNPGDPANWSNSYTRVHLRGGVALVPAARRPERRSRGNLGRVRRVRRRGAAWTPTTSTATASSSTAGAR